MTRRTLMFAPAAAAAGRRRAGKGTSVLSFVSGTDTRKAAYQALRPLQDEVARAIGNKQVVIKINAGVPAKGHRHESTDVEQVRGILDFLRPIHNRQVIIAEGAATSACSIFLGYENCGYLPLEREYKVKLVESNDLPATQKWIVDGYLRPQPVNIINLFLDPDVYLISACRLKTAGGVIVTLSVKNVVMGSPVCHYRLNTTGRPNREVNEKAKLHGGAGSVQGRELTYNMFTIAKEGVYPDLSVLDGVVGAEGNGPWNATPIRHGVALASNDCIAADRVGAELMGVDYGDLIYLQWCARAGIGRDDLAKVTFLGEDYRQRAVRYKLNDNIERQRKWIEDLRKAPASS